MSSSAALRSPFSLLIIVCVLVASLAPTRPPQTVQAAPSIRPADPSISLYRTTVTLSRPTDRERLRSMGITLLRESLDQALVLVDGTQLTALARLRFEPRATDELGLLMQANALTQPQAVTNLSPLVAQATTAEAGALAQNITSQQQASLSALAGVDSDGDGLSDTQEGWWCTDPSRSDSDGDRVNDGAEVQALKDWLANRRSGPPSASGKPFAGWPSTIAGCRDDDYDSVPDLAESLELGLNPNLESTDRDQFDDGQELFGTTNCPGSAGSCGYGSLPPANTAGLVLFPQMPSWVKAPGNHPLAAALPVVSIDIAEDSLSLERVTEITTEKGTMVQRSTTYSTAKTEGTSSSVADTVTWNEWQEVSLTTPLGGARAFSEFAPAAVSMQDARPQLLPILPAVGAAVALCGTYQAFGLGDLIGRSDLNSCGGVVRQGISGILGLPSYINSFAPPVTSINIDNIPPGMSLDPDINLDNPVVADALRDCRIDSAGDLICVTARGLTDQERADQGRQTTNSQDRNNGGSGRQVNHEGPSSLVVQNRFPVSIPVARPLPTRTETSGRSWGGAQTTTHTQYEEHTVTNGEAFTDGEDWRTATAVNSAHAADLRFTYTLQNTGTDFARRVCEIAFNIYIGDNPNPVATYDVAPELGGDGCLSNIRPDPTMKITRTSRTLPISLEQMQAIDTGGPIRIVMARYVLSTEDYYAQDAANAGVRIAIEDGVDDRDEQGRPDEKIDDYLIPTWGDETVLDVLARYFPHTTDAQGNLIAIWTPEYRSDTPAWCVEPRRSGTTLWCKRALSTAEWWNVYLSGLGDGSEGFQDTPAAPGSVALFRFNQDSDRDGYGDRSELRLGTDPRDAASVPQPELIAGVHSRSPVGSIVTATLSLLNTGIYDAYGVEAVMIAPDDSTSIINNTVGGSGRVRAQNQVIVGSRIMPPATGTTWRGTAVATSGGYYTGQQDRTYTFTVSCANPGGCTVGSGTWSLAWNDGAGASGTLDLSGYRSPRLLSVGTRGVKVGLLSGTAFNGDRFSVEARTPRDTFQYRINRANHTPPLVIVSYNDPQGNHRFVIPPEAMALASPDAGLQPFSGQMLRDPGVDLLTNTPFSPGANTTQLVINNPSSVTIRDARLLVNFIDPQGRVVHEVPTTITLEPGPTIVPVSWNSSSFSPTYHPNQDYIVLAFLTDYEGNILDTAGRPLSSFQADPTPRVAGETGAMWDFGTANRGTLLKRSFILANTGGQGLFAYASPPAGVTLVQGNSRRIGPADVFGYEVALDTAALPAGPYDQTITIRTSDPDALVRTIRIRGTIAAATIDSPPPTTALRPLDVSVPVASGTQGTWTEFSHALASEPQSLHPVRVYDQGYTRLWGVGRYATEFGQGTASAEIFGDGRNGDLVVGAGQTVTINNERVNVSASNTLAAPAHSNGFTAGDLVLFHQTQGTSNVGRYELNTIAAIEGPNTWRLAKPLAYRYDNTNGRAQVIKVPQYRNVTVQSGGVLTAPAWDGFTGGILMFRASGQIVTAGTISMTGRGFKGGYGNSAPSPSFCGSQGRGQQGESPSAFGGCSQAANGGGGGGGYIGTGDPHWGSGGGGGYASGGGRGVGPYPGVGGGAYGSPDLTWIHFGSGGGGGSWGTNPYGGGRTTIQGSDTAGQGGGAIIIHGRSIANLNITANGNAGGNSFLNSPQGGYAGGGGAGGSVRIVGGSVGSGSVQALGGTGGRGDKGNGGAGGAGRIRIEYCDTLSGATNPPASTQKLSCYIAEQIESSPFNRGRLNLPESFSNGRTYQVQYGRRFNFTGAAEGASVLRVAGGIYTSATLDALVSGVGNGPVTLRLDIGNDGSWDWEHTETVSGAAVFSTANLGAAFSAYWSGRGAPAGPIDIPVRISLSKAGQVLLTNLQLTPTGSTLRALRVPAANYSVATLKLAVGTSGSGPLSIAADVGDNGSIDWTWSGTPAFPARLLTGNLAAPVNAYLSGRSGEVDVPIRFYLTPFLPLTLSNVNTSATTQPDAAIVAGDISFSAAAPAEGDMVTVGATLRNPSAHSTGGVTAAVFANVPGWGDWYIGSQYLADIPAGGAASISVPWSTAGFSGDVPVLVIVDPYNRLAEVNEVNNQASATLGIRGIARPAVTLSNTSLSFGSQTVGSPSPAQTITLTNTGTADLSLDAVAVSGDFSATSTCPGVLAAGAPCTISVVFTPTGEGNRSGALSITSDAPDSPHTVNLNGIGVGDNLTPALELSSISLNFNRQSIGLTSAPQSIILTNSGTAPLTLAGMSISGDFALSNTCPASLAVGASCTVNVTFTPIQEESRNGTLTISSNAPNSPHTVALSGSGAASLSFSTGSLGFGSRAVGTISPAQSVTLTNPGNAGIAIAGINVSGDFDQTNTCPATLAPGTSCTVSVTFTPSAVGSRSGTLTVTSAAPGSPHTVSLLGFGTGTPGGLSLSSDRLEFGEQRVGNTSAARTVTITNSSSSSIGIGAISADGDFAQTNTCPPDLAAGSSCEIAVTFTPTQTAGRSGTLSISSSAPGSPHTVLLIGTGVSPLVTADYATYLPVVQR